MTLEAKQEYIKALRSRYKNATRKQKGVILSEFCATSGLSRKHVIRVLNSKARMSTVKPGPKRVYNDEVVKHLVRLWRKINCCSVLLVKALPIWLQYDPHPDLTEEIKKLLCRMSSSTIDRLLKPYRKEKGISSTQPSSFIKSKIPIEILDGKVNCPGFMEADTVAHCGSSLMGVFANTLTMTDLYSGWTENAASLSKTSRVTIKSIQRIRERLPFTLKKFACDNGTEFLNKDLVAYFRYQPASKKVQIVRRRPYKKNDNAHVEQKNHTHVRQIFGYRRIEHEDLVQLMNEIYEKYWNPLKNHFYPVMKLKSKIRVGSKIVKKYDDPRTPYQRILEHSQIKERQAKILESKHMMLNPFELEANLQKAMKLFMGLLAKSKNISYEKEDKKTP